MFFSLLQWWLFLLLYLLLYMSLLWFLLLLLLVHGLLMQNVCYYFCCHFGCCVCFLFGLLWSRLMLLARLFLSGCWCKIVCFQCCVVVKVVVLKVVVVVEAIVVEVLQVSSFVCVHLWFLVLSMVSCLFGLSTPKPQQQQKQTSVYQKIQHCFFTTS